MVEGRGGSGKRDGEVVENMLSVAVSRSPDTE